MDADHVSQHDFYRNYSDPKGLALIINNGEFVRARNLDVRVGTDVDAANFRKLLEELGYKVKLKTNLAAKAMQMPLEKFAGNSDHKKCDSAVVVILSHGRSDWVLGTDGGGLHVDSLVVYRDAKNCPSLLSKPKLFFIQSCQTSVGADCPDSVQEEKVPTAADIFIAHSSVPGFLSWSSETGSWFIQAVCQVFQKEAKDTDVDRMLTRVNACVADAFAASENQASVVLPHTRNRLLKLFFFFPGVHKPTLDELQKIQESAKLDLKFASKKVENNGWGSCLDQLSEIEFIPSANQKS